MSVEAISWALYLTPEPERGLLLALREGRYAVFAFTPVVEKL